MPIETAITLLSPFAFAFHAYIDGAVPKTTRLSARIELPFGKSIEWLRDAKARSLRLLLIVL